MEAQAPRRNRFLERRQRLLKRLGKERFDVSYELWDRPLSRSQRQNLQEIEDTIGGLERFVSISTQEIENDERLQQQFREEISHLDKLMLKAYRAELKDHPRIANWHDIMRCLEQREVLKKAKNVGAERGVKSLKAIDFRATEIIRLAKEGKSWETIRKELIERRILPNPYSRNAFYELRQRLGIPTKKELKNPQLANM